MLLVLLMVFAVDVLLLHAAGRFLGSGQSLVRLLAGALIHVAFTACSLLPELSFLGHIWWRVAALVLSGLTAFGLSAESLLKLLLFCLLHLSLGGITGSSKDIRTMVLGAAGIALAGFVKGRSSDLVPVELSFRGKTVRMTALRDTGNTLHDPVTGRPVLVVEARIAGELTGLTIDALENPVEAMGVFPGLRLIPYRTVGGSGFLLAMQIHDAKIGNRQGSAIVAFSPRTLATHYQALTGGTV